MTKYKYPIASHNVKVQDVIDWACEGLMFFEDKQTSANEKESRMARQSIAILLSVKEYDNLHTVIAKRSC